LSWDQCVFVLYYGVFAIYGSFERNFEHQKAKGKSICKLGSDSRVEQNEKNLPYVLLFPLFLYLNVHNNNDRFYLVFPFKNFMGHSFGHSIFHSSVPSDQILCNMGFIFSRTSKRIIHTFCSHILVCPSVH